MALPKMREVYSWQGIIKQPIGFTPTFPGSALELESNRAKEINHWLNIHNIIEPWVAIDDMDMSEWLQEHFVRCAKDTEGIKQTGLKQKIINTLKIN